VVGGNNSLSVIHDSEDIDVLFETSRLICRRLQPEDFDALYAVYSDIEAMRWVGDGKPITKAQCEEWFKVTASNYALRGYGMFTVEQREFANIVGFCGLVHPGGQEDAEIKYAFTRRSWGQGMATEIVSALLAYGCTEYGLKRIIATVAQENHASQRVLVKAGMSLERLQNNHDGSTTCVFASKHSSVKS
jgi:ribosomal-protein-alanine N-acetyltransferase